MVFRYLIWEISYVEYFEMCRMAAIHVGPIKIAIWVYILIVMLHRNKWCDQMEMHTLIKMIIGMVMDR